MQNLLILQGLPGSGKSTWALTAAIESPNEVVVVNRDSIRNMLGEYWVPKREGLVTAIEKDSVRNALKAGYSVILDATNLNPKTLTTWRLFISNYNKGKDNKVIIQHYKLDTPLWKCVYRDWKRGLLGGRKVGYKVIKNFYNKYYND